MPRNYTDPTPAWVAGALREGVDNPAILVDEEWTPEQKRRWSAQFTAIVEGARERAADEQAADRQRQLAQHRRALDLAQQPPVLRDVAGGVRQGVGDLGSLGLRVLDPAPAAGQDSLADTLNRQLRDEEAAFRKVDDGLVSGGVRGAARSITTMGPLAATGAGAPGVIGGFAASRANQAITEAIDAGLPLDQRAGYVGRAALIEGGVAGAFQALRLGGAESWATSGLARANLREVLKQVGAEATEENITEILDASNQAASRVSGPLTGTQIAEIVKQTTVTTLLTMGALGSVREFRAREQRDLLTSGLAGDYGWTWEQAQGVVDRAAERKGDFNHNLGLEVQDEGRLSPVGLAMWLGTNEQAARTLAAIDNPSRAEWEAAGLPRRPAADRARVVVQLRRILDDYDAYEPSGLEERPVVPAPVDASPRPAGQVEPPPPTSPATPPAVAEESEEDLDLDVLPAWVADNPDAARALVMSEEPSAEDFERAGLARPSGETLGEAVDRIHDLLDAVEDAEEEIAAEEPPLVRPTAEQVAVVSQAAEATQRPAATLDPVALRRAVEAARTLAVGYYDKGGKFVAPSAKGIADLSALVPALEASGDVELLDATRKMIGVGPGDTPASKKLGQILNEQIGKSAVRKPIPAPPAAPKSKGLIVKVSTKDGSPMPAPAPPPGLASGGRSGGVIDPKVLQDLRSKVPPVAPDLGGPEAKEPSFTEKARQRHLAEVAAIKPGSTDWQTADVETLAKLLKGFKVPKKDHAAATERLDVLRNPIPEGADWRTADVDLLRSLLMAKAVHPSERKAAGERLAELVFDAIDKPSPVDERPVASGSSTPVAPSSSDVSPPPAPTAPPTPDPSPAAAEPKAKPGKTEAQIVLANTLRLWLTTKKEAISWRDLKALADEAFGGTLAEGAYSDQDAYEALELALNRAAATKADLDVEVAKERAVAIEAMLKRVPTQTTRAGDKDDLQQFSTPPHYAFAATWVGAPRKGEVVLEPSAGTGSLVVHAKASGATVLANELSAQRAALVGTVADTVYAEDAEQLVNILGPKLGPAQRPTLVLMNPPFSKAGKRMKGKKLPFTAAKHIEQALGLLPEGGRLVAIVGRGMTLDSSTFAEWWTKIGDAYYVRANVGVDGKVYSKMGTDFATRLLVIDKTMPDTAKPVVTGDVPTVVALLEKLKEVRDDRPAATADRPPGGGPPAEPGSPALPGVATGGAPSVDPGERGGDAPGEGGLPGGAAGVRGPAAPGNDGPGSGDVPAGGQPQPGPRAGPRRPAADPAGTAPRPNADAGGLQPADRPAVEALEVKAADNVVPPDDEQGGTFEVYQPGLTVDGAVKHPTELVESAAMASVSAPKVAYTPKIPKELIAKGELSDAQLEAIVHAGHQHSQTIPMPPAEQEEFEKLNGKPAPTEKRRAFFDGDGTGVGKGRIAAGVILDNWNHGRRKAVWITEKEKLHEDAQRDWSDLGGDKKQILNLNKLKPAEKVEASEAIVFTTYTTLKSEGRDGDKRLDQIVNWFGTDYDGVVILDEAHNAGNAVSMKGSRGKTKPSAQALAVVELQRRLPNARVLYLSATGATQVSNLAFADRLGLWGEGTEFASREAFISGVSAGGVAAMELVARDMKATGLYLSRTLSFRGVNYSRLTHALTSQQRGIYDTLAGAWQTVLQNIEAALLLTSSKDETADPRQRSKALSAFWGAHQRFFNQVLTSLQMPSVISALTEDIKAGHAPVIQLVNTMEAATERAAQQAQEEGEDFDDLDLTPRDTLMQLVERSFPVQQLEESTDANGNIRSEPVKDSSGEIVLNQEAVAMRDKLLDELASIKVPDSPLDQIINHFGPTKVAEVTGRKRRFVRAKGNKLEEQKRSTSTSKADIRAFMDGQRDLLLFSSAGATGASYHADRRAKNQKPRRHYVLQAGWRADQAIQGLGRSHRSNQAHAPEFRLVETDLPGHRRFISTIARRLEQLGALSRGQRTAGGGGLFSEKDNLEGTHAQQALTHLLKDVVRGKVPGVDLEEFQRQTGLVLVNKDGNEDVKKVDIRQFLNRLLSLKIDFQNTVFDAYATRLEAGIEYARLTGTLDVGMETIKATKIEKVAEQTIRTDERSGAETKHVELLVYTPAERVSFESADANNAEYRRNTKSGRAWIVRPAQSRTDDKGNIVEMVSVWGPSGKTIKPRFEVYSNYDPADKEEVRAEWNQILENMPKLQNETVHLITGALLPVWNRLKGERPRVRRAITEKGERFLGRVVDNDDIAEVLGNLGLKHKTETPTADRAQEILLQGGLIEFENGWSLRSSRVRDEATFEIVGTRDLSEVELLKGMGASVARMGFKNRVFAPRGAGFEAVYSRLVKSYGVARVVSGTDEKRMYAPEGPDDSPDPPSGGGAPRPRGDVPQKVEVIDTIRRLYPGLSIRGPASFQRQFKVERALGWYTAGLGEMRFRDAHDVVTALHELGHHFDREAGKVSGQGLSKEIDAELMQLGEDLYGARRPEGGYKSEGFAEFIREYLIGAESLPTRAPNLYRWFTTEHLQVNPKEAAKLRELQAKVQALLTQTPQQAIEAFMRPTQKDWSAGRIAANVAEFVDDKLRDSALKILRGMQATGADLSRLEPRHHPYILATYYARTAGGRTHHAALSNTVDLHGRESGKGLRDSLEPHGVLKDAETLKAWKEFMVADVALLRMRTHPGFNAGISKEAAQAIVAKHENRPGFREAAQDFTDFAHRALEPLVQSGAMTEEEFQEIVEWNPIYVPFLRRASEDLDDASHGSGGKAVHRVTKRGSNLPIHDPIDAMLLQYERIQQVAMQADVVRALVRFYDTQKNKAPFLGQLLSEVPATNEAVHFSAGQVRSQILDALEANNQDADSDVEVDTDLVDSALEAFWDERLTVFRQRKEAPKGGFGEDPVIRVVIDGKRRFFQVKPGLESVLEGVTQNAFLPGKLGASVRWLTGLQRLGATGLNPAFSLIRNLARDTLTASVTGDYHFHVPVLSTVRGMIEDLSGGEYARRYHAAGLDIAGMLGQDVAAASGLASQLRGGALARFAKAPVNGLREILSRGEAWPRLMEFQAAYQAGLDRYGDERDALILAGAASKDLTVNFSRAGTASRKLNEVVLFFNAAVQSSDRALRAFGVWEAAPWASTQDRQANFVRAMGKSLGFLTTVAFLLYLANKDKDWWKQLPPHEKWGFLHVDMGGGVVIRVPLPFELGAVFGALPVAAADGPASFREALGVAWKAATPVDVGSMHEIVRNISFLAPLADALANKDWKGAPIVPTPVEEHRVPSDQYGPRTTRTARLLGALAPFEGGMSPSKIEHLLDGYTGGLYRRTVGSAEELLGLAPPRGDNLSDLWLAGTLFLRPGTSRAPNEFYDRLKHLRQRKGSGAATLEEVGELALSERVNRDLSKVWQERRAGVAERAPAAEAEALTQKALRAINEHNARDKAQDRRVGLGTLLHALSDPKAEPGEWPKVTEAEAIEALRAEVRRRGDNVRVREAGGGLTAFGKRQARMLRALRSR